MPRLNIVNHPPLACGYNEPGPIRLFLPNLALVAIALYCGGGLVIADVAAIDFAEDLVADARKTQSADGTISLKWAAPSEGAKVEVQQSPSPSFANPVSRYSGAETGSVLTGLAEGAYFFRIREVDSKGLSGPWSEPFEVQVAFMERGKVVWLLVSGGIIVLVTAGAVFLGHFRRDGTV